MIGDLSLYLVTDRALSGERGVAETVRQAVAGGVRVVQLRDKDATDAEVTDSLVELSRVVDGRALLLVNDRLDAALTARARGARVDGIHLGQGDISPVTARSALGPDAVIGITAHTREHIASAESLGAGVVDYLGIGVVHATSTKPDHPPVLGVEGFRELAAATTLPCVAIGGITLADVAPLRDAGAAGVAVVSALCAAPDPQRAAEAFVARWREGSIPRVLSIAGSDPSGGAGIQADLKSISANGGYGMAVITALTAQNTRGVVSVHVPPVEFLREQLAAISDDIVVDAVKVGMLASAEVIGVVTDWVDRTRPPILVVDPVMVATSGDRLLDAAAETALRELLVRADVVTPNLVELAVLCGREITDWADAQSAAHDLSRDLGVAVVVKGGHLGGTTSPDALIDAPHAIARGFTGPRLATTNTHGTGCSLSSAVATHLARGKDAGEALAASRAWIVESLRAAETLNVGRGSGPIHHFAGLWQRGATDPRVTPQLIEREWWERTADIRRQIDELPFIQDLASGALDRDRFVFYLGQDALYLGAYSRVLAEASRLAPTATEQAFWAQSAHNAVAVERELHESWLSGESGGGSGDAFTDAPGPANTAYLNHLGAAAFSGDYGSLIAALLPCFWIYADLGERLHAGDFGDAALDPQHPYASWLATYADPDFARATREAITLVTEHAAKADADARARMFREFEASSVHEREFFHAPDL